MRKLIPVFSAWVLLTLVAAGCGVPHVPTSTSPPVLNTPSETDPVDLPSVEPGRVGAYYFSVQESSIAFKGLAGVADGTTLRTQLCEEAKVLEWWPADMDITVSNGRWAVSVPLEAGWVISGPDYALEIWQKDNPAIRGKYMFDLVGPPKITPVWVDWLRSVEDFFRNLFHCDSNSSLVAVGWVSVLHISKRNPPQQTE